MFNVYQYDKLKTQEKENQFNSKIEKINNANKKTYFQKRELLAKNHLDRAKKFMIEVRFY